VADISFDKVDQQELGSDSNKKFVLSQMEGGKIKAGKIMFYINKQSKDEDPKSRSKGLSFYPEDMQPLIEILLRLKAKQPS